MENASLDIAPGELVTFLGPSGSGKTTTLSMVAGFTTPTIGDIRVNGHSIVSTPVHKRNIGMVFQNYALFPHMSVSENVAFPLRMRNINKIDIRARVNRALEQVRLGKFADRKPKQLSGGQQQRVALARALVFEPEILLLDEPLGALDAKLREEMKVELKELHHRVGATILFVTHDQEESLTLSDRVAVFDHGKIMQVGTPEELYTKPANHFVANFIGEANFIGGDVERFEANQCYLNVKGLEISGALRDGFPTPQKHANYMLRYDHVAIGPQAEGMDNLLNGVVEEFLYSGGTTKYLINIADKIRIISRIPERQGGVKFSPGDHVKVGWNINDALLVEVDMKSTS